MKIRNGFVSNSSSSSFAIKKSDLTERQILDIFDHYELATNYFNNYVNKSDEWVIKESEEYIIGETYMDNFDMHSFLQDIGIDDNKIEWGD